jgi:hypothetical protein
MELLTAARAGSLDPRLIPHNVSRSGEAGSETPKAGYSMSRGCRACHTALTATASPTSGRTVVGPVLSFGGTGAHGSILCVLPSDSVTVGGNRRSGRVNHACSAHSVVISVLCGRIERGRESIRVRVGWRLMSLMSIPLARPNGVGVTVTTIVAERSASPPIRHKNSSGAAPCARVTSKSDAASTGSL